MIFDVIETKGAYLSGVKACPLPNIPLRIFNPRWCSYNSGASTISYYVIVITKKAGERVHFLSFLN